MKNTNLVVAGLGTVAGLTLAYKLFTRETAEAKKTRLARTEAKKVVSDLLDGRINGSEQSLVALNTVKGSKAVVQTLATVANVSAKLKKVF